MQYALNSILVRGFCPLKIKLLNFLTESVLRLELFASPTSLHFQFTCLKLIVNYCIKHRALYVNNLLIL